MNFTFFALALLIYFFLHSLLAAEKIKHALQKRWLPQPYYRIFFNLFAIASLIPMLMWYFSLPDVPFSIDPLFQYAGGVLLVAGAVILTAAFRQYDLRLFSGWKQWQQAAAPKEEALNTEGLNAMVRHPLYLGTLLLLWGYFMAQAHLAALLVAVIATVYIVVGTLLEEAKLERQYGQAYRDYRREVPMLWPKCWTCSGRFS